jgi:hypothetical protein
VSTSLWEIEDGATALAPSSIVMAEALLDRG